MQERRQMLSGDISRLLLSLRFVLRTAYRQCRVVIRAARTQQAADQWLVFGQRKSEAGEAQIPHTALAAKNSGIANALPHYTHGCTFVKASKGIWYAFSPRQQALR